MEKNSSFFAPPIVCKNEVEYIGLQIAEIKKHVWVAMEKVSRHNDVNDIARKRNMDINSLYKKITNALTLVWILRHAKKFRDWHGPELLPEFLGRSIIK